MARSIWKGNISFGLVTVPVKLYSATSSEELSFRLLHEPDLSPISYERVCEKEGKEVPWEEIVKGYEYEKGKFVVLTDEDFKRADVEATRTIDILDFVNADDVDMMYFDKPYYLEPDKRSAKPYVLLREALAATNRVGIAKVVIRERQHLAAVEAKGKALVLNVMRFQDELLDPGELDLPAKADLDKREVEMAKRLIENLAEAWDPSRYTDDYRKELLRVIHEKLEGKEVAKVKEEPSPKVIDIMTALKASLERTDRGALRDRRAKAGSEAKKRGSSSRSRAASSGSKAKARSGARSAKRLRKAS